MLKNKFSVFLCLSFFAIPFSFADSSFSLRMFLDQAQRQSEEYAALDILKKALKSEVDARDLELAASVDLNVFQYWDNRPSFSSNIESRGKSAELLLQKPFSTGTRLSLLSGADILHYRTTPVGEQNDLSWEVGLTQSLWQDSLGRQTSLRRLRDDREYDQRFLGIIEEQQKLLVEFESLYWDHAYASEELKIRKKNLQLSRQILAWVNDRVKRSASEKADLLQAEALVTTRELQFQVAEENLSSINADIADKLPFVSVFITDASELKKDRDLLFLVSSVSMALSTPTLISSLKSRAEVDQSQAQEKLSKDRLKPRLELGFIYGQKGLDSSRSKTFDEAWSQKNNYHEVGLSFSTPLDFTLISSARRAAELQTASNRLLTTRSERQSQVQWADLLRKIGDLRLQVSRAVQLADLQKKKSDEEQNRFRLGRTTLFQAIIFEQDAAESELLALQLQTQMRRIESHARNYAFSGEIR